MHCCCAVCFGYPSQFLKMLGYIPTAYFYNPNIHPKEEHDRRCNELEKYCKKYEFECTTEEFQPDDFITQLKDLSWSLKKAKDAISVLN